MSAPEPTAGRPQMPGYGISDSAEGMLPWQWATERLSAAHNYWVSTVRPDGRPHAMPVWAVWHEGLIYFSTAKTSVKARNLYTNPRCVVTTEGATEAVIVEGEASVVGDDAVLQPVWDAYKAKYEWDLQGEPMFAVRPLVAFAFIETGDEFFTAATRWTFA